MLQGYSLNWAEGTVELGGKLYAGLLNEVGGATGGSQCQSGSAAQASPRNKGDVILHVAETAARGAAFFGRQNAQS